MTRVSGDRLLVLSSTWPRWEGDATTSFVRDVTVDLAERGWSATALVPHAAGSERSERDGGVEVRRFRYLLPERAQTICHGSGAMVNVRGRPLELAKVPPLLATQAFATRRAIADRRPHVVHAHWAVPQGAVAALACARSETPYVLTVHGGDVFSLDVVGVRSAKRLALRRARAITVNSSATERAVLDLDADPAKVHRIPMGIDVDRSADPAEVARIRSTHAPDDGPLCVFVGRLVEEKGVLDLVAAVASIRAAERDVRAVLVGEGRDRHRVETAAREAGVADEVRCVGWVDATEVPAWLAAADIVVAPSRTGPDGWVEAQGLAIVEAMAAGRPVIGSDTGGIADAVIDDETGVLVPEADPHALAAAILALHDDPTRRRRLGSAASAHAERTYAASVCADAMSDVLARSAHPGRRP